MKTDRKRCKNTGCINHHGTMAFSCSTKTVEGTPYIVICKDYLKRTPEHEAVVKTLREFYKAIKEAEEARVQCHPDFEFGWRREISVYKEAISTLAHNWITRNK